LQARPARKQRRPCEGWLAFPSLDGHALVLMTSPLTRRALITGANRGLGLETARQLAGQGYQVVVTARDAGEARRTASALGASGASVAALPVPLDVADQASIAAAADHLRGAAASIDVLVNNAGASLDGFDAGVARRTLDTNFFGPLRLTEALLPLIPAGGTIVMVSSGMGELAGLDERLRARFTDPALTRDRLVDLMNAFVADVAAGAHRERGWPSNAYRVSKIGLNALVRVWAPELAGRRIIVNAVCPGWVRTDMGGPAASRSVEKGAASIVWGATRQGEPTGGFFRDGRRIDW
jgi:NAD(P)-dependent dehydrogenase (short-subunit alcohol dehydrogenase family)